MRATVDFESLHFALDIASIANSSHESTRYVPTTVEIAQRYSTFPIMVSIVPLEDTVLRFRHPHSFFPDLSGPDFMTIVVPELGIDVYADNRRDLYEELIEDIRILWCEYALEDDQNLAPKARKLKARLKEMIVEDANG